MSLTQELALTAAVVAAVSTGIVWWLGAAFDRRYGRSYGVKPHKGE